jgi:hypothetical protein
MANLTRTLQDLRQEHSRAQQEMGRLEEAISVLEALTGRTHAGGPARRGRTARIGKQRRRRMSTAGRRRIAAAQRARWARLKATLPPRQVSKQKRTLSAAARNRMAVAQRARWAKLNAEKKQKPASRAVKKSVPKAQASAA